MKKKNRRNLAWHEIAFEDAMRIFEGATVEREMSVSIMVKSEFTPSAW